MNRNHPIIIRFSGANHPIPASPRFIARCQSTDNRPIFHRQSSDSDAETYWPIAEIVETALRDSALLNPEGRLQSVPGGQDKLKVIDLSAVASAEAEAEARETDKALNEILAKLGV